MALEKQTKPTKTTEGPEPSTGGVPSPSRRKLIKGAVAAPAILTLHSGGVLARSSVGVGVAAVPEIGVTAPCIIPGTEDTDDTITNPSDPWFPCIDLSNPSVNAVGNHCDAGTNWMAPGGGPCVTVTEGANGVKVEACTSGGGFFLSALAANSLTGVCTQIVDGPTTWR